jgi:hypothetical protein
MVSYEAALVRGSFRYSHQKMQRTTEKPKKQRPGRLMIIDQARIEWVVFPQFQAPVDGRRYNGREAQMERHKMQDKAKAVADCGSSHG